MDTYQKRIYNMCIQLYILIFGPIRFREDSLIGSRLIETV